MGKRGPKKQTSASGVAFGDGDLVCPDWLGEIGREKWHERIAALSSVPDLLKPAYADALAMYCEAWQELQSARREIELNGSLTCMSAKGGEYQHPAVGIKNQAIARIKQFGALFGMSPVDSKELQFRESAPADDPMTQMLKQRMKKAPHN